MFWIILWLVVCILVIWEIKFRWKYRSLNLFPGPIDIPFLGAVLHFYPNKRTLPVFFDLVKYYGSIVRLAFGRQMNLLITDLEMYEFFLRSPKFTTKADIYIFLKPWLGKGVLLSEGSEWRSIRKILLPFLYSSSIKDYVSDFQSHCDIFRDILLKDMDSNRPIDIYPKVVHFTLDIIAETAMGVKTNVQNNENQEFLNAMDYLTNIVVERSLSFWKRFDFIYQLTSFYKKQQKCIKTIEEFSIKVIEKRRKLLVNNSKQSSKLSDYLGKKDRKDTYLDILLSSTINGELLSNQKIIAEINNTIFGGHDTTASAISIMLYELANNKEVQDKIVTELKEIYGNDREKPVSSQDLSEMRYMDLVIKEVLRFDGVAPVIGRRVTEDVNYKGTIIPKGTNLLFFLSGVHRSPTLYENYNEFIPERFESRISENPFSFIPFSAGPRNCPGQQYAFAEMKVTFATLLRYFEFESAGPDYKMDLNHQLVMKPVNGIYMKIKSRNF